MKAGAAGNASAQPALVRYVYIDVVDFSLGRSVEAQSDIISTLNGVVGQAVAQQLPSPEQVLFLPTGDGMCVCLVNILHPFDLDIQIALRVMESLHALCQQQLDPSRQFQVRVGINENQDNLIRDIKGGLNVVGLGINLAQRVMSVAGPSSLMLGPAVYERLRQRERYAHWLRPVTAIVKHGEKLLCYEYVNPSLACFGGRQPIATRAAAGPPPASATVLDLPLQNPNAARRMGKRRAPAPPSFRIGG